MLEAAASRLRLHAACHEFAFASAEYWSQHGEMMPTDWAEQIGGHDAIFFGAVGWPEVVPDHISLWGSILEIRRAFDQYVNLRPVRLMPGVPARLAGGGRDRLPRRAREHRGRVLPARRAHVRRAPNARSSSRRP